MDLLMPPNLPTARFHREEEESKDDQVLYSSRTNDNGFSITVGKLGKLTETTTKAPVTPNDQDS